MPWALGFVGIEHIWDALDLAGMERNREVIQDALGSPGHGHALVLLGREGIGHAPGPVGMQQIGDARVPWALRV